MKINNISSDKLEWKYIYCSNNCGRELKVHSNIESALCWRCTAKKYYPPPDIKTNQKSDKPRGWKFMKEFVDKDGTVYFEGVEQPKLKGKKEITDVEKIKKEQKKKSIEKKKNKLLRAEKIEKKLLKEYKKKKELKKKEKSHEK